MTSEGFDPSRVAGALEGQSKRRMHKGSLRYKEDDASEISQAVTFRGRENERLFRLSHADTLLFTGMMSAEHTDRNKPSSLDMSTAPYGLTPAAEHKGENAKKFDTFERKKKHDKRKGEVKRVHSPIPEDHEKLFRERDKMKVDDRLERMHKQAQDIGRMLR